MRRPMRWTMGWAAMWAVGCDTVEDGPTWHADVAPIVAAKCATCHTEGDIAPFPLTSLEEVRELEALVRNSVELGTMPPWQPSGDCAEYLGDFDLTDVEKETLLAWIDAGTPEGDADEAPDAVEPEEDGFRVDLELPLPEAYTPVREPDDYRCQLLDLDLDEPTWITGLRVDPDQKALVHHTIVFAVGEDAVPTFEAYDAADEGPGYTCFGGPAGLSEDGGGPAVDTSTLLEFLGSLTPAQLAAIASGQIPDDLELPDVAGAGGLGGARWVGAWVPGAKNPPFPEGTGLLLQPGDRLVAQMHYNTLSSAPTPDQSVVQLMLADEVDLPAMVMPFTDPAWPTGVELLGEPMDIPAGEPSVTHATTAEMDGLMISRLADQLGLEQDEGLVVRTAGLHMHQLGSSGRIEIRHGDGSTSCVLDIPEWDFDWQGSYTLSESVRLGPEDSLHMSCTWDNSAENQIVVDGEPLEPRDVAWGEGTTDEMCLGVLYVTAEGE